MSQAPDVVSLTYPMLANSLQVRQTLYLQLVLTPTLVGTRRFYHR